MRLVLPDTQAGSQEFADWLARKHDKSMWTYPGPFYGYGFRDKEEQIAGAAVLEPFHSEESFLMNISIETPLIMRYRDLIRRAFHVPFSESFNASRLSVIIRSRYTRTIRVAQIIGFETECVLARHFGEEDGVLLGMTEDPLRLAV